MDKLFCLNVLSLSLLSALRSLLPTWSAQITLVSVATSASQKWTDRLLTHSLCCSRYIVATPTTLATTEALLKDGHYFGLEPTQVKLRLNVLLGYC